MGFPGGHDHTGVSARMGAGRIRVQRCTCPQRRTDLSSNGIFRQARSPPAAEPAFYLSEIGFADG